MRRVRELIARLSFKRADRVNSNTKHVLSFVMNSEQRKRLEHLIGMYGHKDVDEMMNHALTAWEWIVNETVSGRPVGTFDFSTTKFHLLSMPVLERIRSVFQEDIARKVEEWNSNLDDPGQEDEE